MFHACFLVLFVLLSCLVLFHSAEEDNIGYPPSCPPFHCGKLNIIGFPFSNDTNPECGLFRVYDCHDDNNQRINLGKGVEYHVDSISHANTIHIVNQPPYNCESFENMTLPHSYFSFIITHNITLLKCPRETIVSSDFPQQICKDFIVYYNHTLPPDEGSQPSIPPKCSMIQLPAANKERWEPNSIFSLLAHDEFSLEVQVSVDCYNCYRKGGQCHDDMQGGFKCLNANIGDRRRALKLGLGIGISAAGFGILMMVAYCCCSRKFSSTKYVIFWKNKENRTNQNVEVFLKNTGSFAPKRYSYSDVKRMTNSFKYELGKGGFGCVYKGKLNEDCLVAVKILNNSKGKNGEEFMNELASISRTSHVNIVSLLGFCFEGSHRALIYEFMPNGSLEKFIYDEIPRKSNRQLGWETLYRIAIGIARGLEYLHRGCNTRILHFDIKPHNILLDGDFCPKISDFGLAKLCPKKESIISMLGARGTIGYIAPEVFCRTIGGVSHKSDVYSFGMMVLEMVGGRKNIDVGVGMDHTSQIYFPHWIYNRIESNNELGLRGVEITMNDEENEKARKMILVSLWCIQTDPSNRPPMSRVLEMLEGKLESLQIPPKPFLSSPSRAPLDSSTTHVQTLRQLMKLSK